MQLGHALLVLLLQHLPDVAHGEHNVRELPPKQLSGGPRRARQPLHNAERLLHRLEAHACRQPVCYYARVGDDPVEKAPGLPDLVAVVVVARQVVEDGQPEEVELVEVGVEQGSHGLHGAGNAGDAERVDLPSSEHEHDDRRRAAYVLLRGVLPAEHLDKALDGGPGRADLAERGVGEAVGLDERREDAGAEALLVVRARREQVIGVGHEVHVQAVEDAAVKAPGVGVVEEAADGDGAAGGGCQQSRRTPTSVYHLQRQHNAHTRTQWNDEHTRVFLVRRTGRFSGLY